MTSVILHLPVAALQDIEFNFFFYL